MISHIIKEESGNPSVFHYIPNFLSKDEEKALFDYLENTNNFVENPKMVDTVSKFSRLQKWYNIDKKYFCPMWKERYPHWESFEMDDVISGLIDKVQKYIVDNTDINKDIKIPFINSCLINKYPAGENFIAPHRDSALSFGLEPTIIGLSIGQTRNINFERLEKDKKHMNFSFELESSSMFIMGGSSQCHYHHSINKTVCENVRYSLTFREFIL
jgi:alkylated DNA repair dioxygenase AlkB